MPDESLHAELLTLINRTPLLQSVLYDLNLLPEQTRPGSAAWDTMLAFARVYREASQEAPSVVIEMEGGTIDRITTSSALRVTLLDRDVEGGEDDPVITIDDAPRYVSDFRMIAPPTEPGLSGIDATFVADIHDQIAEFSTRSAVIEFPQPDQG